MKHAIPEQIAIEQGYRPYADFDPRPVCRDLWRGFWTKTGKLNDAILVNSDK